MRSEQPPLFNLLLCTFSLFCSFSTSSCRRWLVLWSPSVKDKVFEVALVLPQRLVHLHVPFLLAIQLSLLFLDLMEGERNAAAGTCYF